MEMNCIPGKHEIENHICKKCGLKFGFGFSINPYSIDEICLCHLGLHDGRIDCSCKIHHGEEIWEIYL